MSGSLLLEQATVQPTVYNTRINPGPDSILWCVSCRLYSVAKSLVLVCKTIIIIVVIIIIVIIIITTIIIRGVMTSHRSGETEDNYIADLAVGLCTGQVQSLSSLLSSLSSLPLHWTGEKIHIVTCTNRRIYFWVY